MVSEGAATAYVEVASREGGVDRNLWLVEQVRGIVVASREGGVDRNQINKSYSSRSISVASREGGVDRNASDARLVSATMGRLPRGGRGSQP